MSFDIFGAFESVTDLVSEFVEDKDRRNEITLKIAELESELKIAMLKTKTVVWVDALIKIMYAMQAFWRPTM